MNISLSVLGKNPILTKIQDELAEIGETKSVKFVWAPGHAGIDGNEKADKGAKKALRQCLPRQSMVLAADMITRAKFNAIIKQAWQRFSIVEPNIQLL
jgi:hypothetical protein